MNEVNNQLILLLVVVLICFGVINDDSTSGERTAVDVRSDFQNLNIQLVINDLILGSKVSGVFSSFRIIAPVTALVTNKRPRGAANNATNRHKSTSSHIPEDKNILPIARFLGCTLII